MIEAYSVATVRAAEEAVMAGLPEGELMRRAAGGLATVVRSRLRGRSRVVALAGAGNNGGDALYAAADLARSGVTTSVVAVSGRLHGPALAAAREAGVPVMAWGDERGEHPGGDAGPVGDVPGQRDLPIEEDVPADRAGRSERRSRALEAVKGADVVVDGILGIGGRPGLPADVMPLIQAISADAYVVAVDVPSGADPAGLEGTTHAVAADETVTFGVAKPVHLLPATEHLVGRLTLLDIGLGEVRAAAGGGDADEQWVQRLTQDDVARLWPVPGRRDDKYSRGVVGVVAGGENYTGAALLCVLGAVCSGSGMVRYVGPPTPATLVRAQVPEAVHGAGRVQAWVVGPGLDAEDPSPAGVAQRQAALAALASQVPAVVDAGGLDLVDAPRQASTLLTPHAGELARLLTRLAARQQDDARGSAANGAGSSDQGGTAPVGQVSRADVEHRPVEHAQRLADFTGATVLLKGYTTVVVAPKDAGLPVRSQADASPWMATAGSGDVLAGIAGTLLAAGLSPLDAGSVAAVVHGRAGHAANPGGPLRASAIAHALPAVVSHLMARSRRGA